MAFLSPRYIVIGCPYKSVMGGIADEGGGDIGETWVRLEIRVDVVTDGRMGV